jgi:mannosyltransferase
MYEYNEIEDNSSWLVLTITLIGGVLRMFLLGSKGIWLDEAFSIWVADHSVTDLLHWVAAIDQHPPLYYLLLHYWTALNGNAPFDVRMFSALFGTATIPIIYLIGKRLSSTIVGVAAAVLLAVSPFNIAYSQETRMYSLLTFNAAVAIYALVRLLTDSRSIAPIGSQFREYIRAWRTPAPAEPDIQQDFSYKDETRNQTGWARWKARHRWLPIQAVETDLAWVVFILFSVATMLSHNTAVFFTLATNVFVLGLMLFRRLKKPTSPPTFQAPSFWNWVKAQIGIFILWSPWLIAFIQQTGRVAQEFWLPKPTWNTVVLTFQSFLNASAPGQASQVILIWILYALVLLFGLLHFRKSISKFFFLAALLTIPFLVELIVSIRRPIFMDRTLIWTTIPLFLLLAAGIAQVKYRVLMITVLGIFSIYNLISVGDYFRFYQKEDWSSPAGYVAKFIQNDDLVLFNASWVQIPFDYYFETWEDLYSIQVEQRGVPADLFDAGILEPIMTESDIPRLVSLLSGHKRVYLVYSHNSYTDPAGLIEKTLASHLQLVQARDFYGVQVQVYEALEPDSGMVLHGMMAVPGSAR